MNISFTIEFSSNGFFIPGSEGVKCWAGTDLWENQHGRGRYFELNLIWVSFLFEYSRKKNRSFVEGDGDE